MSGASSPHTLTPPRRVTIYYNRHNQGDPCAVNAPQMLSRYISSIYWAATTIATVGYGDIVPTTDSERGFVIVALFVGASFFSYIVGSVCGVIAKLMEKATIFESQMTKLNAFIRAAKLTGDLPTRLRAFCRYQNTTTCLADWTDILDKLTPALRSAVAMQMHSSWCGAWPAVDSWPLRACVANSRRGADPAPACCASPPTGFQTLTSSTTAPRQCSSDFRSPLRRAALTLSQTTSCRFLMIRRSSWRTCG